jgi:hypothetical protein
MRTYRAYAHSHRGGGSSRLYRSASMRSSLCRQDQTGKTVQATCQPAMRAHASENERMRTYKIIQARSYRRASMRMRAHTHARMPAHWNGPMHTQHICTEMYKMRVCIRTNSTHIPTYLPTYLLNPRLNERVKGRDRETERERG